MDDNCGEWLESIGVTSDTCAKLYAWMTIVESEWNLWVCVVDVVSKRQVWVWKCVKSMCG